MLSFGSEVRQGTRGKPGLAKRMYKMGVVVFVAFLAMDSTMAEVAAAVSTAEECNKFGQEMLENVTMPNGKLWSAEMTGCGYNWTQNQESGSWYAAVSHAQETKCTGECETVYKFLLKHAHSKGRADCSNSRRTDPLLRCLKDSNGKSCGTISDLHTVFNDKYTLFDTEFQRMGAETGYTRASNLEEQLAAKCAPNKCQDDAQELAMLQEDHDGAIFHSLNELMCHKAKVNDKDRYCFADLGEAWNMVVNENGLTMGATAKAKAYVEKTYCSATNLCPRIAMKLLGNLFSLTGIPSEYAELGKLFALAEGICHVSDTPDKKPCTGFITAFDSAAPKCSSLSSTECKTQMKDLHKDWGCCVDTQLTVLEKVLTLIFGERTTKPSAYDNGCKDIGFGTDTNNNSQSCAWYDGKPSGMCGTYDDDDHTANVMCCACGGGVQTGNASGATFAGVCQNVSADQTGYGPHADVKCSVISTSYVKCETPPTCADGYYGDATSVACSGHNQAATMTGCTACRLQKGCAAQTTDGLCMASPLNQTLKKCATPEDGYHVIAETGQVKANLCPKKTTTQWTTLLAGGGCSAGCESINSDACVGDTHNTSCLVTTPKPGYYSCGMKCPGTDADGSEFSCTPSECTAQSSTVDGATVQHCETSASTCSTVLKTRKACTKANAAFYLKGDVAKACTSQTKCLSDVAAPVCSDTLTKQLACATADPGYHVDSGVVKENVCAIPNVAHWKESSCVGGKSGEACFWEINKCSVENPDGTTVSELGTETPNTGYFTCGIDCLPNAVEANAQIVSCTATVIAGVVTSADTALCELDSNAATCTPSASNANSIYADCVHAGCTATTKPGVATLTDTVLCDLTYGPAACAASTKNPGNAVAQCDLVPSTASCTGTKTSNSQVDCATDFVAGTSETGIGSNVGDCDTNDGCTYSAGTPASCTSTMQTHAIAISPDSDFCTKTNADCTAKAETSSQFDCDLPQNVCKSTTKTLAAAVVGDTHFCELSPTSSCTGTKTDGSQCNAGWTSGTSVEADCNVNDGCTYTTNSACVAKAANNPDGAGAKASCADTGVEILPCKADGSGDCLFSNSPDECEADANCETSATECAKGQCVRALGATGVDCNPDNDPVSPKLACTKAKPGYFLTGRKGKPQDRVSQCTQQEGCLDATSTVCLDASEGDISRYTCVAADVASAVRPGYYLSGKKAVQCAKHEGCRTSVTAAGGHANNKPACFPSPGDTTIQQCATNGAKDGWFVEASPVAGLPKLCFDFSGEATITSCKTCTNAERASCTHAICAEGKYHFVAVTDSASCTKSCEIDPTGCKTAGSKCQCDGTVNTCHNDLTGNSARFLQCVEPNTGFYITEDSKVATACTSQANCATSGTACSTSTGYTDKYACTVAADGYSLGGTGNDAVTGDTAGCTLFTDGCNGDAQATCSADGVNTRTCTCATGYSGTATLSDTQNFAGCSANTCILPQTAPAGYAIDNMACSSMTTPTFTCETPATCASGFGYEAGVASVGYSCPGDGGATVELTLSGCEANQDCQESGSACTAACEVAADRTWTVNQAKAGGGAACPTRTDCTAGQDACVTPTLARTLAATRLVQKDLTAPAPVSLLEISQYRNSFKRLGESAMRHRVTVPALMKVGMPDTTAHPTNNALMPNSFVEKSTGDLDVDAIRVAWAQAIGKPLAVCSTKTDDPLKVELRFSDMSQETCGIVKNEMKNDIAACGGATGPRVTALSCVAKTTAGLSLLQTAVEGDNSTTSAGSIITATVNNPNQPMAAAVKAALYSFTALSSRAVATRKGRRVGKATVIITGGDPKAEAPKDDKKCGEGEIDVGGNCLSWWMIALGMFGIILLGGGSTTAVQGQQKSDDPEEGGALEEETPVKHTKKPLHATTPKVASMTKGAKKAKEV